MSALLATPAAESRRHNPARGNPRTRSCKPAKRFVGPPWSSPRIANSTDTLEFIGANFKLKREGIWRYDVKKLSGKWASVFVSKPETGMGVHTGDVTLNDGRTYKDVIFDSGYIIRVRTYAEIPFKADEIATINITGRRWEWAE